MPSPPPCQGEPGADSPFPRVYPYPLGVSTWGLARGPRGASRPDLDDEGGGDDASVSLELRPELVEAGAPEGVVGADARAEGFRHAVVPASVAPVFGAAGFGGLPLLCLAVAVGELLAVLGDDGDVGRSSQIRGEVGDRLAVVGEPEVQAHRLASADRLGRLEGDRGTVHRLG